MRFEHLTAAEVQEIADFEALCEAQAAELRADPEATRRYVQALGQLWSQEAAELDAIHADDANLPF